MSPFFSPAARAAPVRGRRLRRHCCTHRPRQLGRHGPPCMTRAASFPRDNFGPAAPARPAALTCPSTWAVAALSLAPAPRSSARWPRATHHRLILVMRYLQHSRLQDSPSWPEALRLRVAATRCADGGADQRPGVVPDLGTPPAAAVLRRPSPGVPPAGWPSAGAKIYFHRSHGLSWFKASGPASTDEDPLVGACPGATRTTACPPASSRTGTPCMRATLQP